MRSRPFSVKLREAIEQSGKTRYQICKDTGLSQAALCRFFSGKKGLGMGSIDVLMEYLGLDVVKVTQNKGR